MRLDTAAATLTGTLALVGPEVSVPYIGIPVNMLFACAVGTYAAFAMNKEKIEPRAHAIGLFIVCMFMGGMLTSVVQFTVEHALKVKAEVGLLVGIAGLVSFITFYMLPVLAEIIRSKEWVDWIPFLSRKKEQ